MKDCWKGEHFVCGRCESMLSRADTLAFVVLVPVHKDSERVRVKELGVCLECSKHGNRWLVHQGVRPEGLSPTSDDPVTSSASKLLQALIDGF